MRIGVLELLEDTAPADWVVAAIQTFGVDIGSLVPEGFAAYARILHPAAHLTPGDERPVRWADIASANGRVAHPEMQFPHLTGYWPHRGASGESLWNHEPDEGCLPRDHANVLAVLLASFTTTPERCWFCVWAGFGGSKVPYEQEHKVQLPQRTYHLLSGPIDGINETFHQPVYAGGSQSAKPLRRRRFFRWPRRTW